MVRVLAILLSALAIAVSSGPANSAKHGVTITRQSAHRPANLYRAKLEVDRSTCESILASLNKPLDVPIDFDHSDVAGDVLLGSKSEVPWQRKNTGLGNLDYTDIDLANDGKIAAVYRYGYVRNERRGENELFVLAKPTNLWDSFVQQSKELPDLSKETDLISALDRLSTADLYDEHKSMLDSVLPNLQARDRDLLKDSFFNVNILSIDGRSVLLLAGADESSDAIDRHRPFNVFALLYHANRAPSLVCEFRGGT